MCRGPSMCWIPNNFYTMTAYNALYATAALSHSSSINNKNYTVYDDNSNNNSLSEFHCTFKLNINISQYRHQYPENASPISQKAPNCVWWSGSAWTRSKSLEHSPRPSSWVSSWVKRGSEGAGGKRDEGRGWTPMSEVYWHSCRMTITWLWVSHCECFILKFITIDTFSSSAVASSDVSSLAHEVWYDAVKAASLESKTMLTRTQGTEVF